MIMDRLRFLWSAAMADELMRIGALIVAGSLALGIVVGLVRLNSSAGSDVPEEKWTLPNMTRASIEAVAPEDFVARFWTEKPIEVAKKPDAKPQKPAGTWRLLGIVNQGATKAAVIETDGKMKYMSIGSDLPDGSKLSQIANGQIVIDRQESSLTVKLFSEIMPQ